MHTYTIITHTPRVRSRRAASAGGCVYMCVYIYIYIYICTQYIYTHIAYIYIYRERDV